MEDLELTKKVLDRIEECPTCHAELIQTSEHILRCKECGLLLEVQSGKHRFIELFIVSSGFLVAIGLLIGFILLGLKHV